MKKTLSTWGGLLLAFGIAACTSNFNMGPNGANPTPTPSQNLNRAPVIKLLESHRFKTKPDCVTLWAIASDPDRDPLKYTWSTTEGILSSTAGTAVELTAAATKSIDFVSTVNITISDGRGGTAEGSLNVQFNADGTPKMVLEDPIPQPTPEPDPTPTPEPTPTPGPTPQPIQQDGRTFYLEMLGNQIMVRPGSLTLLRGQDTFRFLALNGGWDIEGPSMLAATVMAPSWVPGWPWGSDAQFGTGFLDSGAYSSLNFNIYLVKKGAGGYPERIAGPLRVSVTKTAPL